MSLSESEMHRWGNQSGIDAEVKEKKQDTKMDTDEEQEEQEEHAVLLNTVSDDFSDQDFQTKCSFDKQSALTAQIISEFVTDTSDLAQQAAAFVREIKKATSKLHGAVSYHDVELLLKKARALQQDCKMYPHIIACLSAHLEDLMPAPQAGLRAADEEDYAQLRDDWSSDLDEAILLSMSIIREEQAATVWHEESQAKHDLMCLFISLVTLFLSNRLRVVFDESTIRRSFGFFLSNEVTRLLSLDSLDDTK